MFSIRSLRIGDHVDGYGLLSHTEMSRIRWRRGLDDRELIVEIEPAEMVLDIRHRRDRVASHGGSFRSSSCPRVYTTVVGQFDDLALGCPGIRIPPRD